MTIEEIKGHKLEIPPAETGLSSLRQRLRRGVSGYPKSSKHHFSNKIICRGILQQHDLASLLLHVYYGRILCSVELTSMPRLRHASTSLQPTARPQISMPPLRLQRASRDPDLHTPTSLHLQRASRPPDLHTSIPITYRGATTKVSWGLCRRIPFSVNLGQRSRRDRSEVLSHANCMEKVHKLGLPDTS